MQAIVAYGNDSVTVEGRDDNGDLIEGLGKPGFDRALGLIADQRMRKAAAALHRAAKTAIGRVSDEMGKLDDGLSVRITCTENYRPMFELRDAAENVVVPEVDDIDEFITLLRNQSVTKFD